MRLVEDHPDLFTCGAYALVNPVNTEGVSGKGLALEFKRRFPRSQRIYERWCRSGALTVGRVLYTFDDEEGSIGGLGHRMVIHFPTKSRWRDPSRISFVRLGMHSLAGVIENVDSVAIPALGCGLGGLRWEDVRPVIVEGLRGYTGTVFLFPPREG